MMKAITSLFLIFISSLALAQSRLTIRSENLKSLVEKRSERIQAKELEAQAASRRTGHLVRSFLPTIEVYGGQETFKRGQQAEKTQPVYGAEARLNLFNGGRDSLESSRRKVTAERTKLEKSVVLADEVQKVRKLYWTIIFLKERQLTIAEALKKNDSNLSAAQRRIRSGVATEADRVEFEMNAIDLKREQLKASQELSMMQREFLITIGYDPNTAIDFTEDLIHEHKWENLLEHSEEEHFDLTRPSELRAEELTLQAKMQNRTWLPKLDAYASWNQYSQTEEDFAEERDRQETVLGLRLSLSLGDAISARSEGGALRAEAQAAQAEASYLKREVENHIHSEMSDLKLLHSFVHEADENIKRADRYYKLTQSEYSRGVKNSPDVLSASEKVFEAHQRRLEILRDFQIAKTHVLSKIGR
jgi:outer membrane protein